MQRWLNVGVQGMAYWPEVETSVEFDGHALVLKPRTDTHSSSVHVALNGQTDEAALTLINRFLSILAWCDDAPVENLYGWSGSPLPVAVPLRHTSSAVARPFHFARNPEPDQRARLALALFREGRTVKSIPFAFLSYFKILNIFWNDRLVTLPGGVRQNPLVEGIRNTLPQLGHARSATERVGELQREGHDVPNYLYASGRCAIAHAHANPLVDPDELTDLRRLSRDECVVKALAAHLIESQLGVSRWRTPPE